MFKNFYNFTGGEKVNEKLLVLTLGRGTQRVSTNGSYEATEDIEVCDEKGAHLPIGVPEDDTNPNSRIGGGKLNMLAAIALWKRLNPALMAFAFANRAKYLQANGHRVNRK